MLTVATSLQQLNWAQLMALYEEGNRENGEDLYPDCPPEQQLFLAEQDFYDYLRGEFFSQPGDLYCLWTVDGIYVSALRLQKYQDGLLLEALETHPGHRGRGYATALLQTVLRQIPDQVYSHVAKDNAPSLRLHEKCGFRVCEDTALVDGSYSNRFLTLVREKQSLPCA